MKKKVIALMLATVLCLSTSLTSLASSQTPGGNSEDVSTETTTDTTTDTTTTAGPTLSGAVGDDEMYSYGDENGDKTASYTNSIANAQTVNVVNSETSEVEQKTFTEVINETLNDIIDSSVLSEEDAATLNTGEAIYKTVETVIATITEKITGEVTEQFTSTVAAAAAEVAKDSSKQMLVNVMTTVSTEQGGKGATAEDAFGNIIGSAGTVKNVVDGQPIMLMSVNYDGTVEIVQGIIDPITGHVVGIFKKKPKAISVLVVTYTPDEITTAASSVATSVSNATPTTNQ